MVVLSKPWSSDRFLHLLRPHIHRSRGTRHLLPEMVYVGDSDERPLADNRLHFPHR